MAVPRGRRARRPRPLQQQQGLRRAGHGGVAALLPRQRTPPVGVASARAGNVIGGGDWAEDRLVPDCVRSFAAGEPVVPIRHPQSPAAVAARARAARWLPAPRRAAGRRAGIAAEAWNFGPPRRRGPPGGMGGRAAGRHWGDGAQWEPRPGAGHPRGRAAPGRRLQGACPVAVGAATAPRDALPGPSSGTARFAHGADAAAMTIDQIERYQNSEGRTERERR